MEVSLVAFTEVFMEESIDLVTMEMEVFMEVSIDLVTMDPAIMEDPLVTNLLIILLISPKKIKNKFRYPTVTLKD